MECINCGSKVVLRLDKGEELVSSIKRCCIDNGIKLAGVSAIGAVSQANIGIFLQSSKKYITKEITGSIEIVSLSGNITQSKGEPYAHLHIVLTDDTYNAVGGHLNQAVVGPTCEVIIDVIDGKAERTFSEEIGLNLIKFGK